MKNMPRWPCSTSVPRNGFDFKEFLSEPGLLEISQLFALVVHWFPAHCLVEQQFQPYLTVPPVVGGISPLDKRSFNGKYQTTKPKPTKANNQASVRYTQKNKQKQRQHQTTFKKLLNSLPQT